MTLNSFRKFTRNAKGDARMLVRMPDGAAAPVADAYMERRADGLTVYVEVPADWEGGRDAQQSD